MRSANSSLNSRKTRKSDQHFPSLPWTLLAIQGTSVPCKCVSSASKETARARSKNHGGNTDSQDLKFHAKQEINFTKGLKEADRVAELEKVEVAVNIVLVGNWSHISTSPLWWAFNRWIVLSLTCWLISTC